MDFKGVIKDFWIADKDIGELAKVYLEESSTILELEDKIDAIFAKKDCS